MKTLLVNMVYGFLFVDYLSGTHSKWGTGLGPHFNENFKARECIYYHYFNINFRVKYNNCPSNNKLVVSQLFGSTTVDLATLINGATKYRSISR